MFNQEEEQQNQRRRRPSVLLLMIAMLILVPIESIIETSQGGVETQNILERMNKWPEEPVTGPVGNELTDMLNALENTEYAGKWTVAKSTPLNESNPHLKKFEGKIKVSFKRLYNNSNIISGIICQILSDTYSDDGFLTVAILPTTYNATQTQKKDEYNFTMTSRSELFYDYNIKLYSVLSSQILNATSLRLSFRENPKNGAMTVTVEIESDKLNIEAVNLESYSEMLQNIILSMVLTFSLFLELYAILRILNNVVYGIDSAEKYSLLTMLFLSMWDCTITSLSFSLSFENERYFVVYLVPTFLACILFAVFQSRMVILIFNSENQQTSSTNFKFNIGIYISFIVTYFVIIYTNLSNIFFLALPFIIVPQLYKNAYRGQQIGFDMNYVMLYAPRFLVLLYLRGYSGNIFNLAPSVQFCIALLLLVGAMVMLMYLQAKYGSRILFPKFLLPKRYEYFEEEDLVNALEEGISSEDCAICLTPVHLKPENEENLEGEHVGKIMKTPCGHRFHGTCLVPWMQHKMDCPTCRTKLPPF